MLNGPALIRVFLVVVAAAVLTGLVQHYWIFDSSPPEAPKPVARATAQSQPVRRAEPPSVKPAPQAIAPTPPPPTPQPASPQAEPPPPQEQAYAPTPAPPETRNAALAPAPMQAAPEPPPARPQPQPRPAAPPLPPAAQAQVQVPATEPAEESAAQEEIADARAVDLVDLNTGTLAELNGLKGGGAIGRAIIQRRPYASTDQLLSKRVLSRAIYQRIRDQVTVR